MIDNDSTFIDVDDGTMYAVTDAESNDDTISIVKAERTTIERDELETRIEEQELLAPKQLQEQITSVMSGVNQAFTLAVVSKLIQGESIEEMDAPDELLALLQANLSDVGDNDDDTSDEAVVGFQ